MSLISIKKCRDIYVLINMYAAQVANVATVVAENNLTVNL